MTRAVIFIEKLTNFDLNNPIFDLLKPISPHFDSFWLILTLKPKIDFKKSLIYCFLLVLFTKKIDLDVKAKTNRTRRSGNGRGRAARRAAAVRAAAPHRRAARRTLTKSRAGARAARSGTWRRPVRRPTRVATAKRRRNRKNRPRGRRRNRPETSAVPGSARGPHHSPYIEYKKPGPRAALEHMRPAGQAWPGLKPGLVRPAGQ